MRSRRCRCASASARRSLGSCCEQPRLAALDRLARPRLAVAADFDQGRDAQRGDRRAEGVVRPAPGRRCSGPWSARPSPRSRPCSGPRAGEPRRARSPPRGPAAVGGSVGFGFAGPPGAPPAPRPSGRRRASPAAASINATASIRRRFMACLLARGSDFFSPGFSAGSRRLPSAPGGSRRSCPGFLPTLTDALLRLAVLAPAR